MRLKSLCLTLLTLQGCANVAVQPTLPARPEIKTVKVRNGTISGEDLDNVIENHISAWKYIEDLIKLGGFRNTSR